MFIMALNKIALFKCDLLMPCIIILQINNVWNKDEKKPRANAIMSPVDFQSVTKW